MDHGIPESPKESMEFLSRTWSVSAVEVCKALAHHNSCNNNNNHHTINKAAYNKSLNVSSTCSTPPLIIRENIVMNGGESHHQELEFPPLSANHFSFNSSATSQLVLDRIMSHSEVSPLTSGRLSHSSEPMNGVASSTDSPTSPSEDFDDIVKFFRAQNSLQPLFTGKRCSVGNGNGNGVSTPSGAKTVGRWLKDRKEKKKEEARAQNAQLHAAISVAAVAAAVAAIAAATAAASAEGKNEESAKTDMAVASAATLVAAQCVEAAEAMGAEHDHLASVVSSAVNVHSHDDITTLTAAAATALRGAATLKARTTKEFWNIAALRPIEKGPTRGICGKGFPENPKLDYSDEVPVGENFLGICIQEFLAKGSELLKRTRKGELHWKIVSAYINRSGQVVLKTKSRHAAGTITKRKKNIVLDVCKDVPAWPGRHLFDGGEQRRYFGLKIATRGIIEFECKNKREYEIWTQGISRLLSLVSERKGT